MKKRKKPVRRGQRAQTRQQVTLPASNWDEGPGTARARHLTIVEDRLTRDPETGQRLNPNGVKGRRRLDVIDFYRRKGLLTETQYKAAVLLRLAWEKTMRGPPAIKEIQVDTSPKPDQNISIIIDRIGGYHKIARHMPQRYRQQIVQVVMDNKPIDATPGKRGVIHLRSLRAGLDVMAEMMML